LAKPQSISLNEVTCRKAKRDANGGYADRDRGSSDVRKETLQEELGIVCVAVLAVMHLVDRRSGGGAWCTPQLSDSNPETHPDFDSHTDSASNPFAYSYVLAHADGDTIANSNFCALSNSNFDALTRLFFDLTAERDGSRPGGRSNLCKSDSDHRGNHRVQRTIMELRGTKLPSSQFGIAGCSDPERSGQRYVF